jgi:hypothetical protein
MMTSSGRRQAAVREWGAYLSRSVTDPAAAHARQYKVWEYALKSRPGGTW